MDVDGASGGMMSLLFTPEIVSGAGILCIVVVAFFVFRCMRILRMFGAVPGEHERVASVIRAYEKVVREHAAQSRAAQERAEELISITENMIREQAEALKLIGVIVTAIRVHTQKDHKNSNGEDPVDQAVKMLRGGSTPGEVSEKTGLDTHTVLTLLRIQNSDVSRGNMAG